MTTLARATHTLVATDLTGSEAHAPLWRTLRTATWSPSGPHPGLPPGGLVTAAGYWFAEAGPRPDDPGRCVVVVRDLSEMPADEGEDLKMPGRRHFPRVHLSGTDVCRRCPAPGPIGGLRLAINGDLACVAVDPSAWTTVAAPVLLTISLCWRLDAIARQMDRLADWPRGPLPRDELGARVDALRRLVLDLPCFEGPLIDPRGYFSSTRPARLFQTLVKRLELDSWRALIDERVEIVEGTLEALVEERRHREVFGSEVLLETLILLALLTDVAINLYAILL